MLRDNAADDLPVLILCDQRRRRGNGHEPDRRGESGDQTRFHLLRCLFTSFVISNMFTVALPPKTGFSVASALIMRLLF